MSANLARLVADMRAVLSMLKKDWNGLQKAIRVFIIIVLATILAVGMAAGLGATHTTTANQPTSTPIYVIPNSIQTWPVPPAPTQPTKKQSPPTNNNPTQTNPTKPIPVTPAPVTPVPAPAPKVVYYTVKSGDTVSEIAVAYRVSVSDIVNANHLSNGGNSIAIGERLAIPGGTVPKSAPAPSPSPSSNIPSGNLTQGQLEQLWIDAGGNPAYAHIASAIAEAESSGRQYAEGVNPGSVDRGYWQINSCWGSMSTYDPLANAKAAIYISHDGTNWRPWTTYVTGAYLRYM